MAKFSTRMIAELSVSEEIINLLITNESLLEDYNLFLQNVVLNGDKSLELVIQGLEQKKTDSLILELVNKKIAKDTEIIDLISEMCEADNEKFDNLNLYTI